MDKEKHIVISLGGSLIVPDEIDTIFIQKFIDLIKEYAAKGYNFIISPGGGKIARRYQKAGQELGISNSDDLDWIGIATTKLNSEFLRIIFGNIAEHSIILDPYNIPNTIKPILIGGSWKPGNSSDLAAIICAETISSKKVINLSNIDYAYDKDPKEFPDAVKIEKISWPDFRNLLPTEWHPGLNAPFDPIAAEKAESLGLEVVIINGKNIENFKKYLDGEKFVGTIIR